ncbi:MAG: BON domain-containing protein [Planctomycetes bacterium]|nr:BON domain-containing protein [Planctomycetota bacterium]MCH9723615.1 BON domain-containing protein [Planctomycetota bacterium]MCH9778433.1 BON domain-containing protein [Planctomycetota bacterium]MCH9791815.1 BON domain-containing protein [Planctomycetota bacterium]MDF1745260.1 BON domain-containing protein [Gimesia sp.]
MKRYRKWVLTLGIMAVTPGITMAGPFDFLNKKSEETSSTAVSGKLSTNQRVANEIADTLRKARLTGYNMEIEYNKGVAVLTGKIPTAAQKTQATRLLSRINGVSRVDNRLEVSQPATNQVPTLGKQTKKSSLNPFRKPGDITQASVSDPFLKGSLKQAQFERSAENQGSNVQTISHKESRRPAVNNQQMAEQIAKALGPVLASAHDVEIRFKNGTAILQGAIGSPREKQMATQIAQRVPGVRKIDNRLQVLQSAPQQTSMIQPTNYKNYQAPHPGQGGHPAMAPHPGQGGAPQPGMGAANNVYNSPHLPEGAWPTYANYPNYAQVSYPSEYSASAFPYIGPFYPYPQVPLGWREAQLEWDDGSWKLNFRPRTERWWWFMNPKNW